VAQTRRLHFAKRLIDETGLTMTEVALASGYGSVRRFNAAFRANYGRTPSDLRHRRRGRNTKPGDGIVLKLAFRPPYDWQGMLRFLAARAVAGIEQVDDGCYARTIEVDGKPACIAARCAAGVNAVEIEIHGVPAAALFNLVGRAKRMFDLSVDPASVELAFHRDRLLAPLAKRYPGPRIPGVWDGFECAVRAVLNDGSPATEQALVSRLVRSCGMRLAAPDFPHGALTYLFPGAAAVAAANLHDTGLDAARIRTLTALAGAVVDGRIDFALPAEELIGTLVQTTGIDASMAQYIALRGLGEPDAFPTADPVLRRQAGICLGGARELPGTCLLANLAGAWRPWRGYAAMLLWRADAERKAAQAPGLHDQPTFASTTPAAHRPQALRRVAPSS
jgi:AraC family transcriptional regulator of adaptative response / DNA-3-methyladenine glycosylase II